MIRILHLSDPHFGAVDLDVAEKFLIQAPQLTPDLTILSGDLTMRARHRELSAAKEFFERLPQPRLVIPGNHDIPLGNHALERFVSPFKRYRATFGPELEPELIMAGVQVVSVNSAKPFGFYTDWSEGRLSSAQLASMERKFAAGPEGALRILVLHHPLLELQIPGRAVVKPLRALMESIERSRVDVVMCGHFHRSQIHAAGITPAWKAVISQAPTVCSTRLQGEPQGFHEFRCTPDRLEVIHHVFQNGNFISAGLSAFHRLDNGWHDAPAAKDAPG